MARFSGDYEIARDSVMSDSDTESITSESVMSESARWESATSQSIMSESDTESITSESAMSESDTESITSETVTRSEGEVDREFVERSVLHNMHNRFYQYGTWDVLVICGYTAYRAHLDLIRTETPLLALKAHTVDGRLSEYSTESSFARISFQDQHDVVHDWIYRAYSKPENGGVNVVSVPLKHDNGNNDFEAVDAPHITAPLVGVTIRHRDVRPTRDGNENRSALQALLDCSDSKPSLKEKGLHRRTPAQILIFWD